jgi:solute carrier family 45 protein 1/2/4
MLNRDSNHKPTPLSMVLKIFRMTTTLPPRIRAICHVQFWTWIGWFPFLFYSPTWVGETYFHSTPASDLPQSPSERLGALGRIGSLSLVIFSLVTFLASIVLPFVVRSPDGSSKTPSSDRFTPRPAKFLEPVIKKLDGLGRFKPDLLTAWFYAHFIFATTMLSAPLVGSLHAATLVVAFSGLPWALAGWAPYALMGVEINRLSLDPTASSRHFRAHSLSAPFAPNQYRPSLDLERARDESESPTLLRLKHAGDAEDSDSDDDMYEAGGLLSAGMGRRGNKDGLASTGETAGVYLGILNLFTTLPQFVGTFISMIVFSIFEQAPTETAEGKEDGADTLKPQGVNPIAVCLFIGGVCSLVAAWATRRLRRISRG